MVGTLIVKPLGLVLQKAGLVSPEQVQIALNDRVTSPNKKIGEIMAVKGWIEQQTADFFADQWPELVAKKLDRPLGQYLKAAGLLDESQIDTILTEQKTTGLKFGAVAVVKGLIAQKTLDFFLEQLELIALKTRPKNYLSLSKRSQKLVQIENYVLHNTACQPLELIKLYQQVWQQQAILATDSIAEAELLHSGLVVKQNNHIKLGRLRQIFDHNWIEQQLAKLEPYSKIRLKLFRLETKASLPYKVLTEVRLWTNNQAFLTQKIYQIIQQKESFISQGKEAEKIATLVEKYIINNWTTGAAQKHLTQLSSALLRNRDYSSVFLLKTYQKIWQQSSIHQDDSQEQAYLLDIGLIKQANGQVSVANRIYRQVFNYSWVETQLNSLNNSLVPLPSQQITTIEKPPTAKPNSTRRDRYKIVAIVPLILLFGSLLWLGSSLIAKYWQIGQFQRANQLWQAKNYHQAVAAYDRLLQNEAGNHPSIWINRGYALAGLEKYDAMLHSCSAATSIEPNSSLGWNCQGEALYHQEQYQLAVKAFEKALDINPNEPIFWINHSESLFLLEQYQAAYAASKHSTELIENNPNQNNPQINQNNLSIAYNRIGEILLLQKKYRQALDAFEQSLAHSSDYLSAQQGRGIALYELGLSQQASEMFNTILQRQDISESEKVMTWLYQGINFCDAEQFTAAEIAFKRVVNLETDPESLAIAQAGCSTRQKL